MLLITVVQIVPKSLRNIEPVRANIDQHKHSFSEQDFL